MDRQRKAEIEAERREREKVNTAIKEENERLRRERAEAKAKAEDEALKEAAWPAWQLDHPESTRETFLRLWPLLKTKLQTEQEKAAIQSAIARKRGEAMYRNSI